MLGRMLFAKIEVRRSRLPAEGQALIVARMHGPREPAALCALVLAIVAGSGCASFGPGPQRVECYRLMDALDRQRCIEDIEQHSANPSPAAPAAKVQP